MGKIILALDQGTSSSRAILFNEKAEMLGSSSEELTCRYPEEGWVEQDPEEIWSSQWKAIQGALDNAEVSFSEVVTIGITNQRETIIAWNKQTGEALTNAIVWQCRRTSKDCEELKRQGYEASIKAKTGLVLDPYFSGTKIRWMLKNVPKVQKLANSDDLAFGTVDSWLIWKLTGGKKHVTDASNASRTLLFNIHSDQWDEEILSMLGIPRASLPEVFDSSGLFGVTSEDLTGCQVPITGVAGDQQASLFGQACFEKGSMKNTYGTGCFLVVNSGDQPLQSQYGLLSTVAWRLNGKLTYAMEGSVFIAGALIQWLRDNLQIIQSAGQTQKMAESVKDNGGVYLVPAFVGLGTPYWDSSARGILIGITRDTNRGHIVRASLEAICYQVFEVVEAIIKDADFELKSLKVDGGGSENDFICQFQSDLIGFEVARPKNIETTAMGAAFLAGLSVNIWKDLAEISGLWKEDRVFHPERKKDEMEVTLNTWKEAVQRSLGWKKEQ